MNGISYFLIAIMCIFTLVSCEVDQQDEKSTNPENDLLEGWHEYNSGNYESAILAFEKVLNGNSPSEIAGDAYNGLGWAYLNISKDIEINRMNLDNALNKFNEAIKHDKANSDAWIGQAYTLLVRRNTSNDLRNTLKTIDSAQQGKSEYLYRHDYDSEADLHALKAQCYYYLGELDKTQSEIESTLAIEKDNSIALAIKTLIE